MTYVDSDDCSWQSILLHTPADKPVIFTLECHFDSVSYTDILKQAVESHDQVLIMCAELHRETVDFIKANQYSNITYFTCGYIDGIDSYRWMEWFINTVDFYRRHIALLDKLTPHKVKPFYFDILLGCYRPHRDFVFKYVKQQIDQKSIMTYYGSANHQLINNSNFISEDGIEFNGTETYSSDCVKYMGEMVSLSKIIPINVYNQTAYSIVAETNAENDFVFCTEKIVKPILAQRLFIVFAGYNYLKHLRSLGFQTFDCVIDESYDQEPDNIKRYNMACDQMLRLSQLPQEEVFEKIKPIVKHNQKVMLETDWFDNFHQELRSVIMPSK